MSSLLVARRRNSRPSPEGLGVRVEERWWVQERNSFLPSLLNLSPLFLCSSLELPSLSSVFPQTLLVPHVFSYKNAGGTFAKDKRVNSTGKYNSKFVFI